MVLLVTLLNPVFSNTKSGFTVIPDQGDSLFLLVPLTREEVYLPGLRAKSWLLHQSNNVLSWLLPP